MTGPLWTRPLLLACLSLVVLLAACGAGGEPGPPTILYGEDICDRCRMVISEQRHAAGARVDGLEHRFDDPGCLLEFLDAGYEVGASETTVWVNDEAGSWLPVTEAWFVIDPQGGTPMASGILAFASADAAAGAADRLGGEVLRWQGLRRTGSDGASKGVGPGLGEPPR